MRDTKKANRNGIVDVATFAASYVLRGIDIQAMLTSQWKNIEAWTEANRRSLAGLEALGRRQAELGPDALQAASAPWASWMRFGGPADCELTNTSIVNQSFEKAVASAWELTELAAKSNTAAFNVIANRVSEGLAELHEHTRKRLLAEE